MPDERKRTKEERKAKAGGAGFFERMCKGAECLLPSFRDHMTKGKDPGRVKVTPKKDDDDVVIKKEPEKVGYQAGTAKWDEPTQEKPEESGTGMTKAERDARMRKYKTRY